MKRPPDPTQLPEAVTEALNAVDLVYDAIREAQKRVAVSQRAAQDEKESRVAKAIAPIMGRLQAARGSTTFARMRLREIERNIGARERRRNTWRASKDKS